MTLNDNPLVEAEKRYKQLLNRRDRLISYSSSRISIEYENGIAARLCINPYVKSGKASKLISKINRELGKLYKFLKNFK
jgi:hypothetical protein